MVDDRPGHEEELHLLQGLVVTGRTALLADGGDAEVAVEELLQIGVGAPTEGRHPYAIQNYLLKLPFEAVDDIVVLIDDILASGLINQYAPQLHFQNGSLESTAESISGRCMIVQLW